MAYKVIKSFIDLQDKDYRYRVGDVYPRHGASVTDERIEELATGKNRLRRPLIEKIADVVIVSPIEVIVEDTDTEVEPIETVDEVNEVDEVEEVKEAEPKPKKTPVKKQPVKRGRPKKTEKTDTE